MDKKDGHFSITGRLRSFQHAFAGIAVLLREQHNAWIHALATAVVVGAGLYFGLDHGAWLAVILTITLVWVAEALNTALEYLCDLVSPDFHPLVKKAKDVAAAAVLLAAFGAVAVAAVVFLPHIKTFI